MFTNSIIKKVLVTTMIILTGGILPWWSFSVFIFLISLITYSKKESIINGFIIGFLSWFLPLSYSFLNAGSDTIFSKISLLIINIDNPILLIIISSLVSGLIGLLSGWAGAELKHRGKQ